MTNDQSRLREQCFLLSFLDEFARLNGSFAGAAGGAGDPAPGTPEAEFLAAMAEAEERGAGGIGDISFAQGSKIYDNFVCVMARNPASVVSRLVTDRGLTELFNMTPAQMAGVMPKIRIFKVRYNGPNDNVGTQQEFIFGKNQTNKSVLDIISSRSGRGSGVGLKNFDWQLIGTNTAEVDNNIKANLSIHFNSFQDFIDEEVIQWALTQANTPPPPDPDPADPIAPENLETAVSGLEEILPEKANYLDLIFRSTKYADASAGAEGFNPRYYRIKVVVGWTVDQAVVDKKLINSDLATKIESTGTTLLLNLLRHDIDFREDGTIELKLEYHAAVEGMLTDNGSNLLYASDRLLPQVLRTAAGNIEGGPTAYYSSDADTLRNLQERQRELEAEQQEAQTSEETPGDEEDECYEPYEGRVVHDRFGPNNYQVSEQIEDDIKYVRQAQRRIMTRIYQRLLEELQEDSMYYVDVPESVFGDDDDEGITTAGSLESMETGSSARTYLGEEYDPTHSRVRNYSEEVADELDSEQSDAEIGQSLRGAGLDDLNVVPVAERRGRWNRSEPNVRRIFYFYLGDLLDIALKILKRDDNPEEFGNVRLVLGTIVAGIPAFRRNTTDRLLVNMADIPISLNLFLQFYTDRVIARGRDKWPLRTFIREVFTYLINPALGTGCAERNHARAPNVSIMHYDGYAGANGEDRILHPGAPGRPGEFGRRRIFDNQITPLLSSGRLIDRMLYHYCLIQAGDFVAPGRIATEPDSPSYDAQDGIYWLNIGNDRGLVKSIKFKRTDIQGMAEMRQEREGTIGLGQIREKYDADVTLFGNGLFQPGQLIYINPTAMGLSSPAVSTRLSSILGVGGYYQVIKVDSAISDQTYETVLDTKWIASGTGSDQPEAAGDSESCD